MRSFTAFNNSLIFIIFLILIIEPFENFIFNLVMLLILIGLIIFGLRIRKGDKGGDDEESEGVKSRYIGN